MGGRRWAELREERGNIHYHVLNSQPLGTRCVAQGANPVLCDNLEGWVWEGDGREVQEGGDMCIPVAD